MREHVTYAIIYAIMCGYAYIFHSHNRELHADMLMINLKKKMRRKESKMYAHKRGFSVSTTMLCELTIVSEECLLPL